MFEKCNATLQAMTKGKCEISEFNEADRRELGEMYHEVRSATFGQMDLQDENQYTFDHDTRGEEMLVAKTNGEIVGFISVWAPDSFIHHLYIRKEYQRMGLGSRLIGAVRLRVPGPLTLKCIENNTSAVRFYEKTGWKILSKGISDHGAFILFELA